MLTVFSAVDENKIETSVELHYNRVSKYEFARKIECKIKTMK